MPLSKKRRLRKKACVNANLSRRKKTLSPTNGKAKKRLKVLSCSAATVKRTKLINKRLRKFSYDKGGVKSIYSPFNRCLTIPQPAYKSNTTKKMPQVKRDTKSNGLTSKEKVYILTSCQTRSTRYKVLKDMAADAIKNNKVFAVLDNNDAVRKALVKRGWIEKIPLTRMNLSKIRRNTDLNRDEIQTELERLLLSHFVEKHNPDFIWRSSPDNAILSMHWQSLSMPIVSKLRQDDMWTTKQGLCSSLKRNYWFYIEDISEATSPRTYNSFGDGEVEGFTTDFRVTACTSLLKWVLSMMANDRQVFVPTGKVHINVFLFALNRCKEYLFRKQHKDIDRELSVVSDGQWKAYFKKYYSIINKTNVFEVDKENQLPLYLAYAKFLLTEIHKYRPQLSCEGCHNIWIIKPTHCCRGRGIRMASRFDNIIEVFNKNTNTEYVVQKYIEEPLLIYDTKFDIRMYYLITSTCPLIIWTYKDCYLKFSSQKYNLKNYHESIHLTNNAVQKRYKNCNNRHNELPVHNMWDSDKFKHYLAKIGKDDVWDAVVYPGMKKSVIAVMLTCQESMAFCKNRFELYGCDFILDKHYNPWLIEINAVPDLEPTTPVTAKICPAVVSDVIKVVIDQRHDHKAPTGNFECAYRQPLTIPRFTMTLDLTIRGHSLPLKYFYKGKVEIHESYDDPTIGKERDIKTIMKKMKKVYEKNLMVVPYTDSQMIEKMGQLSQRAKSDSDITEVSTMISEQLDGLIDRTLLDRDPEPNVNKCRADAADKMEDLESFIEDKYGIEMPLTLSYDELTDKKIMKTETDGETDLTVPFKLRTKEERLLFLNGSETLSMSQTPNKVSIELERRYSENLERDIKRLNEMITCDSKRLHVDSAIADLIYYIEQKENQALDNTYK